MIPEMLDGAVLLSPSPGFGGADATLALAGLLRAVAPPDLRVLTAPFPVRLGRGTQLRPDVLVARYVDLVRDELAGAPVLVVEVVSPGSELVDRAVKRAVYARFGVAHYWLVDPETPAVTVLELADDGDYRMVAEVVGAERFVAERPFAVEFSPLGLVDGMRPC